MSKEEVDAILSPVALFVDCAVMGPVSNCRHKVLISFPGSGTGAFAEKLASYGMNITLMEAPAGSTSASKMVMPLSRATCASHSMSLVPIPFL